MKGIKAKPEKREQVLARVRAAECLICQASGNLRRGLCGPCYCRFRRHLAGRSPSERASLERRAIQEGLVLGVQQVRAILSDDPFERL
jgi:hypothetical protein